MFGVSDAGLLLIGTNTTPTTNIVDIFGDGSGIALYPLDDNINDAGGMYDGKFVGAPANLNFFGDVAKPYFKRSLEIAGPIPERAFIIPQNTNLKIKSMSLWVKRLSYRIPSNAYLLDSRTTGGNAYFIWNSSVSMQGITRYLVNGQPISLNYSYKDKWIHLYIEFTRIQNGMVIGFGGGLSGNYDFGGLIDYIRLFNRALTDSEVQQLYNEGD